MTHVHAAAVRNIRNAVVETNLNKVIRNAYNFWLYAFYNLLILYLLIIKENSIKNKNDERGTFIVSVCVKGEFFRNC